MQVLARAKVNLALHVTARRDDGYHELDSVVTFCEVGDRLSLKPSDEISLTIDGNDTLETEGNLVLRAAEALSSLTQSGPGARIELEKRLPVAAGLGGGSADAAATLRGLLHLWGMPDTVAGLQDLAVGLGADVPVCLAGRPARIRGIGEQIDPIALPSFPMLLVNPGIPLGTASVFAALERAENAPLTEPPATPDASHWFAWLAECRNDLQEPAQALAPQIGDCLAALEALEGCSLARMSGSGASCFAIFGTDAEVASAAASIRTSHPGWWVAATRTVS